jgi:hypothetical protein
MVSDEYLLEVLSRQISDEEANHVLYVITRARAGYEPGSFTTKLIDTIFAADPENRRKLAIGFPGYVSAVQLYQLIADGMQRLSDIAAGARR